MPRDQSPVLPTQVVVTFTPYPCNKLAWDDVPATYARSSMLADSGATTATGTGSLGIRDACHAVFTVKGGTPTNAGRLQALTSRVAGDLWRWRLVAYDRAYVGIVAPVLDGTLDALVWWARTDRIGTRLRSLPTGSEPSIMAHSDPSGDCDARATAYGGPDMAAVNNGALALPRVRLAVTDGTLRWYRDGVDKVVLCPPDPQAQAMGAGDDGTMTDEGSG